MSMDWTLPLQIPEALEHPLPVTHVALGLIVGLLGWPIYSALVRLAGVLVGLAGGLAIVLVIDELSPLGGWLVPALVLAAILGALLGVWLIRGLVPMVWLLIGASLGILGLYALQYRLLDTGIQGLSGSAQVAIWAGVALITGLLTVWLRRWIVMIVTAALGAALVAPHLEPLGPPALAWWSAGTAGFFAAQAGLDRLIGLDTREADVED